MPPGAGSACPTRWTAALCTGAQRRGDQHVTPRHTTIMPHLPRWLHPVLQLVSPGLVWLGIPCSVLGSVFAHQRSEGIARNAQPAVALVVKRHSLLGVMPI
jgi:hypothetical protein